MNGDAESRTVVEYDGEIDTVTGVTELLDGLRESDRTALIDWRYAHTLKLQVDVLTDMLARKSEGSK